MDTATASTMNFIYRWRLSLASLLVVFLLVGASQSACSFHSQQATKQIQSIHGSKLRLIQDPSSGEAESCCVINGSRKEFFNKILAGIIIPATSLVVSPSVANSAAPVTLQETDSIGAMVKRKFRPKPPKILRRKLAMDFAVLLMRSSYNSLDQLDCVAMDQFQRDFFLIRSSEYETYVGALGPGVVQQGDLTDPYYFDFISFAQYRTINRKITQNPPFMFEEQQPQNNGDDEPNTFVPIIIKRDPKLTNEMLGPEHSRIVGSTILDKLEETFGGTDSALPRIVRDSKPDAETLLAALKQLVNLFLINGYAYSGNATLSSKRVGFASGTTFKITLVAPATLWGGKVLQGDGEKLNNSFFTKTATELITRAGYRSSSSVTYDGSNEEVSITLM